MRLAHVGVQLTLLHPAAEHAKDGRRPSRRHADRYRDGENLETAVLDGPRLLELERCDERGLAEIAGHGLARLPDRGHDPLVAGPLVVPANQRIHEAGQLEEWRHEVIAQQRIERRLRPDRPKGEHPQHASVAHVPSCDGPAVLWTSLGPAVVVRTLTQIVADGAGPRQWPRRAIRLRAWGTEAGYGRRRSDRE